LFIALVIFTKYICIFSCYWKYIALGGTHEHIEKKNASKCRLLMFSTTLKQWPNVDRATATAVAGPKDEKDRVSKVALYCTTMID